MTLNRTHFVAAFLSAASILQAGVVITSLQEDVTGKRPSSQIKVALEKDRARMEVSGDRQATLIFRKDKDLLWIIDAAEKSYSEMTGKDIANLSVKIEDARKKMQEQLKGLPSEQRAMAEKMMKGMMGGDETGNPKIEFRQGKGKDKVGEWACSAYESIIDGEKSADLCVAPFGAVKVEKADFEVLKDMAAFMGKLSPGLKNAMSVGLNFDQLPGIPVRTVSIEEGKPTDKVTLTRVQHEGIPITQFELPAGYSKKALPMGSEGKKSQVK